MEIEKLQKIIVNALDDVKAQNIVVYNTTHLTSEFERVVIASGSSNRQTRALAYNVAADVKAAGGDVLGVEGTDTGEWVLVDCGNAVVHVLQPNVREYYNLEEIWGDKVVTVEIEADQKNAAQERVKRTIGRRTVKIVNDTL